MKKSLLLFALLLSGLSAQLEMENTFSNTNFAQYAKTDDSDYKFIYNRFRWENRIFVEDLSSELIVDNDTVLGPAYLNTAIGQASTRYAPDIPFETSIKLGDNAYDRVKLYRASVKYSGEVHALTLGLQRVAFGVGRFWTPTDMFNPLRSLSLESAQRAPVLAAHYALAFSDTGGLELVSSIKEDNTTKYAARIKEYVGFADMGVIYVYESKRQMAGYEIEGHLFDTGIEYRSEGGLFTNTEANKSFVKAVVGADYAFENSLMVTVEYLYNQTDYSESTYFGQTIPSWGSDTFTDVIAHKSSHYLAVMAGYTLSSLSSAMMMTMYNIEENSAIFIPSLSYSLSDESTLSLGGFIGAGADKSEFESIPILLFGSLSVTF